MDNIEEMREFDELDLENVVGGYSMGQFMTDLVDYCKDSLKD